MLAYILNLATLMCINAVLAITLNFIMGYAGIFSIAHAIFFGVGAYSAAYFALNVSASIFLVIPVAMAVAGLLSLVLALPALRVRGEYFVAASLGLQVLGVTVFSEWKSVTGGLGGMIGIPPADIFGHAVVDPVQFLLLAVCCLIPVLLVTSVLLRSSFGRNLKAIRDSESAAHAFGKNVAVIKTMSVVISAMLAAVAGALYAFYMGFINVESFMLDTSVLLMAMVIIGGTGTLLGPIVGTVLLMLLPGVFSYMSFLPQTEIGSIQQIAYGLAMVLLMIYRPGGIVGSGKPRATKEQAA
ncbi:MULTISPECIES: branched-chain amino acid ABC transporter permease [unclassified Herbaspirillum]|uniref:branched-chain amino acid ABC transporter permease n=1 Tax=unclassified Herbaspirillum TaxID=2624150 RepID=UPI001153080A|nr:MULTISPECIES: branched-chain amino acid ABC transporter permease [unclassified Herbaspirillum]MBB5390280.1 branched-chain amino acid transport system permease protein [Herbaspirillum sp. SJZ102]TQK09222.1 amino acid/amide ABC transporter membrane protein 2 (HAAT family) [Herbaspirillum sp. SJZ130]TQK14091.1 amino acid/amide ABC transporter membrane protein 2 (HAAT family) [Herbaspirillum sp. SJZ106]TWC69790.1 amino acid/amide ABC transporter membrane protein 2 (HAAT family) [Herbaspirillum s